MTADREVAYAKLNLALHVRGRMPDGYHELDTIFAFCASGDLLSVEPGEGLSLHTDGPFAEGLEVEDNLVLKAGRALASLSGSKAGARLSLTKNLPVASGIGGGSADAAAALRLLNRFWKAGMSGSELLHLAADLGADVPACVRSETARGTGRGDALTPLVIDGLARAPALLVNPCLPLATARVFGALENRDSEPLGAMRSIADLKEARNDLERPAGQLVPEVDTILAELNATDPLLACMSGSGATCFALYETASQRDTAAGRIDGLGKNYWTMRTNIR